MITMVDEGSRSRSIPNAQQRLPRARPGGLMMPGDMGHVAKEYRPGGTLLETLGGRRASPRRSCRDGEDVLRLVMRLG